MKNEFSPPTLANLANLAKNTLALLSLEKAEPARVTTPLEVEDKSQMESVAKITEPPFPPWCSKSCTCLDELDLPDGKIIGCVQKLPAWKQAWQRLDRIKDWPLKSNI